MSIHSRQKSGEEIGTSSTNVVGSPSRRSFLQKSAFSTAVVVPVVAAAGAATRILSSAAPSAHAASVPNGEATELSQAQAFREIQSDENAHVAFLKKVMGFVARPRPIFQNLALSDRETFKQMAKTFENLGVSAYLLAIPAISNKDFLASVASILTIEARHASYLDALFGEPLSPNGSFDTTLSLDEIAAAISPFIKDLKRGPDPTTPLANDFVVLNFILLLEYIEAHFYDVNVPTFFK